MNPLVKPIMHLVDTDFTSSGNLKSSLLKLPVIVMFQTSWCGACKTAKPHFQMFANMSNDLGQWKCMTVQGDGELMSERNIMNRIKSIYPNFKGYPSYMLFKPNGEKISHTGGLNQKQLQSFVMKNI